MFCNRCGCALPPASRFCSRCGTPVVENTPPSSGQQYARRLHTLGALWVAMGAICLLPSLIFMGFGMHGSFYHSGWNPVFSPIPLLFGIPSALLGLGAVVVGWGLLHREPWARGAAIVAGILFIFHPPFGTLLGIFTLWALLSERESALHPRTQRH
jgi:zinc-ribbon domain